MNKSNDLLIRNDSLGTTLGTGHGMDTLYIRSLEQEKLLRYIVFSSSKTVEIHPTRKLPCIPFSLVATRRPKPIH